MNDIHYPNVNLDFIETMIKASGKLASDGFCIEDGELIVTIKGNQPLFRRRIKMRISAPGELSLIHATALAYRFSFLGKLMHWLEINRNWKEGSYVQRE